MSRSTKKHAITGVTTCRSEKWEKVQDHQRKRVELRTALARDDHERAERDWRRRHQWFQKDGKARWTGTDYEEKARRK